MSYEGQDKRHESWHIKKELTWTHILSTLILAGTLIAAWGDVGTRIDENAFNTTANAREIVHVRELDEVNKKQMQNVIQGLTLQYDKIDEKLDKIIDRELNGN